GVIVDLPRDVHVHARIGGDRVFELLKSLRRGQVNRNGLKDVVRPLQDFVEELGIAPGLGIEGGASGVKDADHLPAAAAELNRIPESKANVRSRSIPA